MGTKSLIKQVKQAERLRILLDLADRELAKLLRDEVHGDALRAAIDERLREIIDSDQVLQALTDEVEQHEGLLDRRLTASMKPQPVETAEVRGIVTEALYSLDKEDREKVEKYLGSLDSRFQDLSY